MTEFYQVTDLMKEDEFWQIIETSLRTAQAQSDDLDGGQRAIQYENLREQLNHLTWQKLIEFNNRFTQLFFNAYDEKLWCAGYLMNGGCGDDGFMDFRAWLIAQGKDAYYNALKNADSLANLPQVTNETDYYAFEEFSYLARRIFKEKFNQDMDDYLPTPNYDKASGKIIFSWNSEDDDSMKAICPKLFEEFCEA